MIPGELGSQTAVAAAAPRRRGIRVESAAIARCVVVAWRAKGARAGSVAIVATVLTVAFVLAEHHGLASTVDLLAGVRQSDSLVSLLLRTPLSIFAAAPNLPAWGAIAQVAVVVAVAQAVLGARRTIVVGLGAEFLVNLVVHAMVANGHGSWMGMTAPATVLDTGPSVVVVALLWAALIELRAWRFASLLALGIVGQAVAASNLAGYEHIIGLAAGFVLWWLTGGSRTAAGGQLTDARASSRQRQRRTVRRLAATFVAGAGFVAVVSALTAPRRHHHAILLSVGAQHFTNGVVAAGGVGLIVLSRGMLRGQRRAWALATSLVAFVAVAQVLKGHDVDEASISFAGLFLLIAAQDAFRARTDRRSTLVALRSAVVALAAAFIAALIAVEAVTADSQHQPRLAAGTAARTVLESLFGLRHQQVTARTAGFLHAGVFGAAATVAVISLWRALRPVISGGRGAAGRRLDHARAVELVERFGGGTLDYFILRDDKLLFFTGDTVIGYAVRFGVCLVSPDPIGPVSERALAWAAFRAYADQQGWTLAVLAASEEWLPIYQSYGMLAIYAGDEAVVDSATFSLEGGARKSLRQAVNRVARHEYSVSFYDPMKVSADVRISLQALMGSSRQGGVERGFSMTLGRLFDPRDTGLLIAVCTAADGSPAAFCQFVPSRAIGGWSLDLMRRDVGHHPNGLLDFVIVETIRYVASNGGGGVGLNFATMRAVLAEQGPSGPIRRVQRWVLHRLSDNMQIVSLWHFNAKFGPRWIPRYIAVDGAENTVLVATAIASAESLWELPVVGRWLTRRHERPDFDDDDLTTIDWS